MELFAEMIRQNDGTYQISVTDGMTVVEKSGLPYMEAVAAIDRIMSRRDGCDTAVSENT